MKKKKEIVASEIWHVTTTLELKKGKPEEKAKAYFTGPKQDCELYIEAAMLAAHG